MNINYKKWHIDLSFSCSKYHYLFFMRDTNLYLFENLFHDYYFPPSFYLIKTGFFQFHDDNICYLKFELDALSQSVNFINKKKIKVQDHAVSCMKYVEFKYLSWSRITAFEHFRLQLFENNLQCRKNTFLYYLPVQIVLLIKSMISLA